MAPSLAHRTATGSVPRSDGLELGGNDSGQQALPSMCRRDGDAGDVRGRDDGARNGQVAGVDHAGADDRGAVGDHMGAVGLGDEPLDVELVVLGVAQERTEDELDECGQVGVRRGTHR